MNYFGQLLSNFKGFYNEINSATLTGAIDVVIVQQEDGTYVSSPFHVRFGKMGVLRAREKVVDIEINGEPVDLHMKLGEGGAAFFVQELEETTELPAHLATSPLPDSLEFMEEGLKQLKLQAQEAVVEVQRERQRHDSEPPLGAMSLGPKVEKLRYRHSEMVIISGQVLSDSDLPSTTESSKMSTDIAIQTDMTGSEVETKARSRSSVRLESRKRSDKSRTPPGEKSSQCDLGEKLPKTLSPPKSQHLDLAQSGHSPNNATSGSDPDKQPSVEKTVSSTENGKKQFSSKYRIETELPSGSKSRRKRHKRPLKPKTSSSTSTDLSTAPDKNKVDSLHSHLDVASIDTQSGSSVELAGDEMFEMDDLSDGDSVGHEFPVLGVGRTISLPVIEERHVMTDEWASSQYASHIHPFSDGDITPIMSPVATRPPSPKSDTEFENQKYDATAQTQLTGDDMENMDAVKWEWGELPISTPVEKSHDRSPDTSPDRVRHKEGDKQLSRFMRETKKIRHQPEKEGIYLDDLEMDPELAALYLYPKNVQQHMRTTKDEDCESGRGASLPHSPITVERDPGEIDRHSSHSIIPGLPGVSMSLCGGLKESEGNIPAEKFHQAWVTYDELCENPGLMNNPNLVIHMGDKYYNWEVAAPMIMSAVAFHRPLPEPVVDSLVKKSLPKKRRGWFSWGRGGGSTDATTTTESLSQKKDGQTSPVSSPASSTTNSPQRPLKERKRSRKRTESGELSTDDESDTSIKDGDQKSSEMLEELSHRHVYRKSLKLTTEQIEGLHLKEGVNEISFSVTTQYQGTSRCTSYIYLWKWDDRIVISDIDGTITKSDVLGQVLPMIGKDWSQAGIANLYSMIARNGYKFLYLSARAIGQSKITRDYLRWIQQNDLKLPEGPLLLSPSSLISAFHKEVIERKPEEFKIGCLRDISGIFPPSRNPFYSGFGNKINDVWAYRAVGIPISRIFTVNSKGELKMCHAFQSTYTSLTDIVDHFFPPLLDLGGDTLGRIQSGNFPAPDEFSTFTYWRDPLPELESDELEIFVQKSTKKPEKKEKAKSSRKESTKK